MESGKERKKEGESERASANYVIDVDVDEVGKKATTDKYIIS